MILGEQKLMTKYKIEFEVDSDTFNPEIFRTNILPSMEISLMDSVYSQVYQTSGKIYLRCGCFRNSDGLDQFVCHNHTKERDMDKPIEQMSTMFAERELFLKTKIVHDTLYVTEV